ncbi:MAG: hypothetical protein F6J93_38380 [Oscillatoria sp. SIO1A7]|nr:hypothetical protein [Oscillatoria sp. SIO1A7]
MTLKYLMDENVDPLYANQIRRREPSIVIKMVGEPETPPKGTLDPEILVWCEDRDFALVTNNRSSMPVHLTDHIAIGRHVPGIFMLNSGLSIDQNIERLIEINLGYKQDEYLDQIVYLTSR